MAAEQTARLTAPQNTRSKYLTWDSRDGRVLTRLGQRRTTVLTAAATADRIAINLYKASKDYRLIH